MTPSRRTAMTRPTHLLLALLLALALAACGSDDDTTTTRAASEGDPANVNLAEAQSFLEDGDLALVREARAGGAAIAEEVDPAPAESARLASRAGAEFDLLVYATPHLARASWESLLATDAVEEGARAVRAVNLIAVFPERGSREVHAVVARRLRELDAACSDPAGDRALRALCYDPGAEPVPPPGRGTQRDELAPAGAEVTVRGVRYRVTIARQLNPYEEPDEEILGGRRPDGDNLLFGVFLHACNPSDERPARSTDRLTLVGPFGSETRPITLPADNPFAYEPTELQPGACVPRDGSVAARAVDGALLAFEIPPERLQERPLGLQIVGPEGATRATVKLDV
jgi:hypothetical protein